MRAQEFQPEPIYYFAYGMLTDPRNMPGAEAVGAATLPNHRFEFQHFADVVPEPGEQVHGVLWQIPRELLSQLDQVEGVPWLYNRKTVPVRSGGRRYEAYVYTMTPRAREDVQNPSPSRDYVRTLARGYTQFGLPVDQIRRAIQSAQQMQEAAMNPTAYADSMAAAAERGVLIGFEFEVYVPETTLDQAPVADRPGIEYFWTVIMEEGDPDLDVALFNQLFRPKQPIRYDGQTYSSMEELVAQQQIKDIKAVRKSFARLAKPLRQKILSVWRRRRGSSSATEAEFIAWLGDYVGRLRADTDLWRDVVPDLEDRIDQWDDLGRIRDITQGSTPSIINDFLDDLSLQKFQNSFDYDDEVLKDRYRDRAAALELDDDSDGEYQNFARAARVLEPAVETTMGSRVQVFDSYHARKKNMTDWYIEPDGSLEEPRDYRDGAAEIVSPPLPVNEAMSALKKFYGMARSLDLYTNESTGLHINVSIPDQLDVLKLAMFLGDQYVLQAFNREDSEYAQSVLQDLQRSADPAMIRRRRKRTELDIKALQRLAKEHSRSHFASISDNGKYISFRHAGGDYLGRPQEITDLVGRFVRAMVIAADPQAYRQEYFKKLTRLVGSRNTGQTPITSTLIQGLRRNGVPVLIVDTWHPNYAVLGRDVGDEFMDEFDDDSVMVEPVRASRAEIAQAFAGAEVTGGRSVKWARFRVVPVRLEDVPNFSNQYLIGKVLRRNPNWRAQPGRIALTDRDARFLAQDIQNQVADLRRSQ